MRGIFPSTYRGHWFSSRGEKFRLCVIRRESHGNYRASNKSGSSAKGAYQFLQNSWGHSLPYMVADALVRDGLGKLAAQKLRKELQATSINKWPRRIQDTAFFAVYRHGDGWRHWYLQGSPCNALAN